MSSGRNGGAAAVLDQLNGVMRRLAVSCADELRPLDGTDIEDDERGLQSVADGLGQ